MELAYYFILLGAALLTSVITPPLSKPFFFACLAGFVFLSIVVRASGYDSDIPVYVERMQISKHDWFFFREPVVWYSQRLLFFVTANDFVTLVVCDVLIYLAVSAALYRMGVPSYALLSVVLFVPFVVGMQNVYRQWVASAFLLLAISRSEKSTGKAVAFYILAALSHNAAAFFFPLVVASTRWKHAGLLLSMLVLPLAVYLGKDTRLASYTGADLGWVYFWVFALLAAGWSFKDREKHWWSDPALLSLFYITYTVGVGVLLLPSSGAERLGLFGLLASYPILLRVVEEKLPHWYIRWGFIIGGFVPLLVFDTRKFLI